MTRFDDCIVDSDNPEAWFKHGIAHMEAGRHADAESCFRRTLVLAPGSQETVLNLGYALDMQGRAGEALGCYEAVLAASPHNAKARYNRAAHLLRKGDLLNGFADYEARFLAVKAADPRVYPQPRWDGSPLNGQSILVYCEQGLGDAIQFARYVPMLAGMGGRVVLEVQPPLLSLFTSLAGAERVLLKSDTPPDTDFHIPLLSLPHLFGTTVATVPAEIPYLTPPAESIGYWCSRLGPQTGALRIGLVWAGKPAPDPNRSCPPAFLARLLTMPGTVFYSMQFGERDRFPLPPELAAHVVDLADDIGDFAKTAALIANLDLVITIDTVIAHLAGAIGKPVWVMLPFSADWRWMTGRNDSPWYPSMRLFRQPEAGAWDAVAGEVVRELQAFLPTESGSDDQDSRFQRALADLDGSRFEAALQELYDLAVLLPDDPAVLYNLGRAYEGTGLPAEAEQAYLQALSASPGSPAVWFGLGTVRQKRKAYLEAENCFRKANALEPGSVDILLSLGGVLSAQRKISAAIDCCRKILAITPDNAEVIYNMASLQLRSGDFTAGFAGFESRLAIGKFAIDPRSYRQPRWDGSPLNGRSILVYGEQGMGDVIQFVRYLPLVAASGGRVVLEVDPPLIPLLESFPGVDRIVPKSKEPPLTDLYIQLLSLPHIFGTTVDTVPGRSPYIFPDAGKTARWRERLGTARGIRIGLVWRGNPGNPRDSLRSCALADFAPLADLPGVELYSLQVGAAAAEAAAPPEGMTLTDCSPWLTDLTETAALLANLDLVIGVDTAVVHLAGAMGRQVWVIQPEDSEWRWLEGRSDSPWYPSMRVFEHTPECDRGGVIRQVRRALKDMLSEKTIPDSRFDVEAEYARGVRLKESGDLEEATRCFRRIVERCPDLSDPHYCLGVVLQLQLRLPEAISCYQAATAIDPGFVRAHFNLANAFLLSARYQDALESAETTLRHDPSHADAHWLHGMLLLQRGDFAQGWEEYEWRWKAREFTSRMPDLGRPQWDGSPLGGRTLLIHMEQGRGDMIQFIRYAPLAAAAGGRVVVCALPELVPLLATISGVEMVVDRNLPLPGFDLHIPVQSLPHVFGTTLETVPCSVPYLRADPVKASDWERELPDREHFRVGLVWQGTPTHKDDHNRSCPLDEFRVLGEQGDLDLFSLQIGAGAEQIHGPSQPLKIIDLTGKISDFSDTAALIAGLDLVISVDTAVAHLAGALGKTVWTLLPYVPEWRWLLGREDTPWYPTMRLFRQTAAGDWESVFRRVRDELSLLFRSAVKLNQFGIVQLKSGAARRAELAFSRAVACDPDNAEYHCNRGVALNELGEFEAAVSSYRTAYSCNGDFTGALFNMGHSWMSLNSPEKARACYERVVEMDPGFAAGYLCLGEAGKVLRDFPMSRAAFERAAAIDPGCADAFHGIAETCQAEEHFEDAIRYYRRALALKPGSAATLNMMGTVFQSLEQLDEAEGCYRQALELAPGQPNVLNNLAAVLNSQGRAKEAVSLYRHLLGLDPGYADGHWNLSVALLALGEYAEGWREFEWRFRKSNPVPPRPFIQPQWDGSALDGRTVLLHAEQGFGDTLQFVRYVPLAARKGGHVIVECQVPALKRLLLSLEGVTGVIAAGEPLPAFDCHLPLMSLPLVFGTTLDTIPASIPYLHAQSADIEEWKERLGTSGAFRVGLVWSGRQSQVLNRKRSCPLKYFAPLAGITNVEFYSLQVGDGNTQVHEADNDFPLVDLTEFISDFADTAALIANLDLVVTIDTAVAHLAGALGARTWILLACGADWRWLEEGQQSPWYPAMRLFRQSSPGDWASLMEGVAAALQDCTVATARQSAAPSVHPGLKSGLKVGLAWSGRQDNPLNRKRSCPFSLLAPLLELENVTFVRLQMDSNDADSRMIDLTGSILDFEDTAALMTNLDLIISIDTSVAHLAAAAGRPTWVLLSHVADWRWSQDGNGKSWWYPGVELFRQTDIGDWESVITAVTERLCTLSGINRQTTRPVRPAPSPHHSVERIELENVLECNQLKLNTNTDCPDTLLDVGAALALLGRNVDAIDVFRYILTVDPEHVTAHLNLAYSLLADGDFSEGWEHLEWRLKRLPPDLIPPWPMLDRESLGSHPAGTSLLVHCEQGFGDTVMFSRFLPLLSAAGYRVIISCQPSMTGLILSLPGVSCVVPHGESIQVCDLQILLLSLPWLFSATPELMSGDFPYLVPKKHKTDVWKRRLEEMTAVLSR